MDARETGVKFFMAFNSFHDVEILVADAWYVLNVNTIIKSNITCARVSFGTYMKNNN